MGSPEDDGDTNEHPQHEIEISKPFYLSVSPITQAQYQRVIGTNPSAFRDSTDLPVEQVAWNDAIDFCRRLSGRSTEKALGRVYALPTEAQWEYACRAGAQTRYHCGDELTAHDANFGGIVGETSPVGSYPANRFGVHDLHGNVWEWCQDLYDANYYQHSPKKDPASSSDGTRRVLRGGSWYAPALDCRAAYRNVCYDPTDRSSAVGFRAMLIVSPRNP
jgi:formylglycine-generating enzyme required for sulfatase activity